MNDVRRRGMSEQEMYEQFIEQGMDEFSADLLAIEMRDDDIQEDYS